jgi:hypothetical protein
MAEVVGPEAESCFAVEILGIVSVGTEGSSQTRGSDGVESRSVKSDCYETVGIMQDGEKRRKR